MTLLYIVLAVAAGVFLPVQAGINVRLKSWAGENALASLISFAVGTLALAIFCLVARFRLPPLHTAFQQTAWWHWTGGLLGAFFVTVTIVLAPRLGATTMIALIIAGQMIASLVVDHWGILGYPAHPINVPRLLGALLLVLGVVLIRRF